MSLNPKVFQKFSLKWNKKRRVDFKNLEGGQATKQKGKPLNETLKGYQKPPEHCLILKAHMHVNFRNFFCLIFFWLIYKWVFVTFGKTPSS